MKIWNILGDIGMYLSPDVEVESGGDVNSGMSAEEFADLKASVSRSKSHWDDEPVGMETLIDKGESDDPNDQPLPMAGAKAPPEDPIKPQGEAEEQPATAVPVPGDEPKPGDEPLKEGEPAATPQEFTFKHWDQEFTPEQVKNVFEACKTYHESREQFDQAAAQFVSDQEAFSKAQADFQQSPAFLLAKYFDENPGVREACAAFVEEKAPEFAEQLKTAAKAEETIRYETQISDLKAQLEAATGKIQETETQARTAHETRVKSDVESFLTSHSKELGETNDLKIQPRILDNVRRAIGAALHTVNPNTKKPYLAFESEAIKEFARKQLEAEIGVLLSVREDERSRHLDQKRGVPVPPPPSGVPAVASKPKPYQGEKNPWNKMREDAGRKIEDILGKITG